MAKIIVALIVVPFALFGIDSLVGGSGVQYVAEVNGEGITAPELQQQINRALRRALPGAASVAIRRQWNS